MAEKHGSGGKAMVNLAKRAKRVQEKMMQKFGKSDQTKDEVYEEFVVNFSKQHAAAVKLQKELTKYMNSLRLLSQNTRSLADAIDELYDSDWDGRLAYKTIVQNQGLLWDDKLTTLQSKMVEPMSHYISRFPEVKNRIQKRDRKVVDYDLTRRELETIKAKPKVTEQKIQQAEEAYTHAKQLYDEISDELYEELPSFYDSRIQFYASLIQSIATTEAKFHSEITKVDEELADLMDSTASEAASGVHSTKRARSIKGRPELLSRPDSDFALDAESALSTKPESLDNSSDSSPSSTPSTPIHSNSSSEKPTKPKPFSDSSLKRQPPTKPVRSSSTLDPEGALLNISPEAEVQPPTDTEEAVEEVPSEATPSSPAPEDIPSEHYQTPTSPHHKPDIPDSPDETEAGDQTNEEPTSPVSVETEQLEQRPGTPPNVLRKVRASHPYKGEDEDELNFEKGEIILVIPYEDPEDEEEGWSMGVVEGTERKGVFPDNFTKPLS